MAEDIVKFVLARQKQLDTLWESDVASEWEEQAKYVIPFREDIRGFNRKGERQGKYVYDGTAISAAILATDGIHGYHVSPAFPWFKYAMGNKKLDELPEVRQYLEDCEFALYTALSRSNFYNEMWSFIYDGMTIHTTVMYCEDDETENRPCFESVHPGECRIALNRYGAVDVLHRRRKLTARQIMQKFYESRIPEKVKIANRDNPFQEFEVIHAVYPREDFDETKRRKDKKRFASVWIHGNDLLEESGYDKFPYAVWLYSRSSRETYGRGPASWALSTILGANIISKTMQGAAQLAVNGPYNIPSEMKGQVQLHPSGFNYYLHADRIIKPVNTPINYPIGAEERQRIDKAIRDYWHVDFFTMLAQMQGERVTAYQVQRAEEEKAAVLGAELGPLNTQLDNILDLVFYFEQRAGRMPQVPDVLLQYGGERFDPVYMGPLAQAQRRLFGSQGLRTALEAITPFVQLLGPEAFMEEVNPNRTIKKIMVVSGYPQECFNTDEEKQILRQGRMQAQQAITQQENMTHLADLAEKGSKADKNTGGKLSQMLEQIALKKTAANMTGATANG